MSFLFSSKRSSGDSQHHTKEQSTPSPVNMERSPSTNLAGDDPMALATPPPVSSPKPIISVNSVSSNLSSSLSSTVRSDSMSSSSASGISSAGGRLNSGGSFSITPFSSSGGQGGRGSAEDELTPPPPTIHSGEMTRNASTSSASGSGYNESLKPPMAGYGVLGTAKIGGAPGLHHIYQTNVLMTPNTSLPNTPNAHASYIPTGSPTHMDIGMGMTAGGATPMAVPLTYPPSSSSLPIVIGRPKSLTTATSNVSMESSPTPPLPNTSAVTAASTSNAAAPTHAAQPGVVTGSAATPNSTSSTSTSSSSSTLQPSGPSEVSLLRTLFRSIPSLSRATFQLGDTLGTGTFGRVRIVALNTNTQSSMASQMTTDEKMICRTILPNGLAYFALKMLKKSEIIRLKQVEHIKAEKAILSRISHPFIVNLYASFQDEKCLYLVSEYVLGGELFSQLRKVGRFSNSTSMFYAAEIISALEYLHSLSICYRDLKPENLLIDREGHIKITDFGFAKVVEDRTWTLCGTPEYLAPEIIQSKGHGKAVDWWALGILIFEMLAGYPPFYDENPFGIYQKILKGVIEFPKHLDPNAKDLVKKLLTADRTKRFGCLQHGSEDIKQHPWFRGLDWKKVEERKYKPPFIPPFRAVNDTSNFDRYPDSRESTRIIELSDKEKALFSDF